MSNHFGVYQSNQVLLVVADIPILDGRADPFVKVSKDEPFYTLVKGVDGHVTRCATNDRVYHVEVMLLGSSQENAKLSALAAIDTSTAGGSGVGGFLLKDLNGVTIMASGKCWIEKPPDPEWGKTPSESVTWLFAVVADPNKMILGGN